MADYLTLTEFVPGTKAKAEEVNANFSAIKNAINTKAALSGDSSQAFSVANASQKSHAVNKSQLDSLSEAMTAEINKTGAKFCIKSGNTTDGKGDLFDYEALKITPKIGGSYANLVFLDYKGNTVTISSAEEMSMSGKPDGKYNIFINPTGSLYTLKNTIYKQPNRPSMLDGDIWFDTSTEPFKCIKYNGTQDIEFIDMPIAQVTITTGSITGLETFPFNQNGHDVNTQTKLEKGTIIADSISSLIMPNYDKGESRNWGTTYTAGSNGWVFGSIHGHSDGINTFRINGITLWTYASGGGRDAFFFPVRKGDTYIAAIGGGDQTTMKFFPCVSS